MSDIFVYKWTDPNLKILLAARNVRNVDQLFRENSHTAPLEIFAYDIPTQEVVLAGRIEP